MSDMIYLNVDNWEDHRTCAYGYAVLHVYRYRSNGRSTYLVLCCRLLTQI
jgi:hypothetical protein